VPERVGHQVREHLADPHRIDVEDRQVARRLDRECHPGGRRALGEGNEHLADEHVGIGRLGMEREGARLGQGDGAEIVDQALHDPRLVEDRGQVRRIGG
jgi:hypothetical protein